MKDYQPVEYGELIISLKESSIPGKWIEHEQSGNRQDTKMLLQG